MDENEALRTTTVTTQMIDIDRTPNCSDRVVYSSNNKLLGTGASLVVTSALLVVTPHVPAAIAVPRLCALRL